MSPILVPTLAELGIELGKAIAVENAAHARWLPLYEAGNAMANSPEDHACQTAYAAASDLTDQIAAIPAVSLADLRVKALAMDWHNRTIEKPDDFWSSLGAQIVAGLLDQRVG